ncbi:unnamed protein product, partial [Ixodes persulcatus]
MIQRNMVLGGLFLAILLVECVFFTTAVTTTCDFETNLCGFVTNNATESGFRLAKVSNARNGPAVDHKPGTDQGSCAYASNTGVSVLRIPSKGPFCFTGWYHHSGIRTLPASFQSAQEGGKNITFRFVTSGVSSSWQRVVYSETRSGTHQQELMYSSKFTFLESSASTIMRCSFDVMIAKHLPCAAPVDGSCDFDWGNACGYSVSNQSKDWALNHWAAVPDTTFRLLRPRDVTVGSYEGGFAIYTPSFWAKSSAVMSSPKLKGLGGKQCLRFYYFMPTYSFIFRDDNHTLEVSMLGDDKKSIVLWKRSSSALLPDEWVQAEVSFNAKGTFQLDFKCSIDSGFHPGFYCAVDAVQLSDCTRPEGQYRQECDFEQGLCSWRNVRDRFNKLLPWVVHGGSIKSTLRHPSVDHTHGNRTGSYLYISTYNSLKGAEAQLLSDIVISDVKTTHCMSFWYIVAGDKSGSLRVKSIPPGVDPRRDSSSPLWEVGESGFDTWNQGQVAVNAGKRVLLSGVIGSPSTEGYIAVDDVVISSNASCDTLPRTSAATFDVDTQLSCTFKDLDKCQWSSVNKGSFSATEDWQFGSSRPPKLKTGPTRLPEEAKDGDFIYASLDPSRNALGLTSKPLPRQDQPLCVTFFYHMFAGQEATLSLSVVQSKYGIIPVFQRSGSTAVDRWYSVQRTVDVTAPSNQLLFLVTSGGFPVEVAIGPIRTTLGACDIVSETQGRCDFERDTCGWNVDPAWVREKVNLNLVRSGPEDSMYFLALPVHSVTKSFPVTSPVLEGKPEPQCLEFWYRNAKLQMGALQVDILPEGSKQSQVLWRHPPYHRDNWMLARVPIVHEKKFQVIFRGNATQARFGATSLKLDDVAVHPRPCRPLVECDFQDDLCGYVNDWSNELMWLVGTGRVEKPNRVPRLPPRVTSDDAWASFAYLDLSTGETSSARLPPSRDGSNVSLFSPIFSAENQAGNIVLDYFRLGDDVTGMELSQLSYEETTGASKVLQTVPLKGAAQWQTIEMALKPAKFSQIGVRVTRRASGSAGMAAVGRIALASKQAGSTDPPPQTGELSWNCDFENNTFCGWKHDGGKTPWKINDPVKRIPAFPRSDHTLQSFKGHFIFAENAGSDFAIATLESPEHPEEWRGFMCFSLWYLTLGDSQGTIEISSSKASLIQNADNPGAHHHWVHEQMEFASSGKPMKFTLTTRVHKGLIAVDDLRVTEGRCMAREKCSFEPFSPCTLVSTGRGAREWHVTEASRLGTTDHTLQSQKGRVLYLNTTMLMGGSVHAASRVSLESRRPTTASCLTFWWKGFGEASDLNVYKYTAETVLRDPIASVRTEPSSWWNVRSVTVSSRNNWMPVFEAVSAEMVRQQSGIMLDDIEITSGACLPDKLCTFEEDVCKPWARVLVNASTQNDGFQLQRAELFDKLPNDHTLHSKEGYYLLFKSTGDKADRASLMLRDQRYRCAFLWYFLSKSDTGCIIRAGIEQRTNATKLWTRLQFDLKQGPIPVGIHVNCGRDKEAFAAIDDLMVDEKECWQLAQSTEVFNCGDAEKRSVPVDRVCDFVWDCPNGADEQNCGTCDFATDTCGWNVESGLNKGHLSWQRKRAGEVEESPPVDWRGSSKGYYLLNHAGQILPGHRGEAVAVAPTIRNTNYMCVLQFWYNYASENRTMSSGLQMIVSGYHIVIWSLSSIAPTPAMRVWTNANILIGRYNSSVQLHLTGLNMQSDSSYMAIDNIKYEGCVLPIRQRTECSKGEFSCGNGVCIDERDVCNYVDNCGDGSDETNCADHNLGCNFDTSFCDWVPLVPRGDFRGFWQRASPYLYPTSGPTRDHTTGLPEGRFLKLSAKYQQRLDALMAGPILDSSYACGITFFYMIYGNLPLSLTLNVRSTANGTLKEVWRAEKQTDFFHFVKHDFLFGEQKPFQVFFRGTIGPFQGFSDYIVIDDVSFLKSCRYYNGTLPAAPPPPVTTSAPVCPEGTFGCGGGTEECIPQSQVCDFKKQCSDGSDEAQCGACDFTQDMCGLTSRDPNSQYLWNRISTQDVAKVPNKELPTKDRNNNPQGFYVAYTNTNKDVPYRRNDLLTPVLGRIAHSCTVSFYSFMKPNWMMTLRFGVEQNDTSLMIPGLHKTFAEVEGHNAWTRAAVKVGNWNPGYRFIFETNVESASIDDITYTNCHPDRQSSEAEAILGVSCDFADDSKCGWFPENVKDDTDWVLYDDGNNPQRWHPPKLGEGAYMAATSKTDGQKRAHLVSMRIPATENESGYCFTFWYNMWHPNSGTLNLILRAVDNSTELIWTRSGTQGKAWRGGSVVVKSVLAYQLVFEAVLPGGNPGVIALNQFLFETCKVVKDPLRMDFESGMDRRWKISGWEVTNGKSATQPHRDHTTGAGVGSFALLRSSDGDFSSPSLEMAQPRCLKFWHYLSGTSTEQLEIRNTQSASTKPGTLWRIDASQVPQSRWLSASVTLDKSPNNIIVTFAGSRSDGPSAVVAVDDVVVRDGACPPPGSCNFEEDLCNWRSANPNPDMMHWYQNSGRTSAWNSTVLRDHTKDTKEGKYLVLDAEDSSAKNGGVLESELLHYTSPVCFEFFYHMAMKGDNKLSVTFVDASNSLLGIQKVPPPLSNGWTKFSYEVKNTQGPFTVRITGSPGVLTRSDIAIDDIALKTGPCPKEPEPIGT